MGIVKVNDGKLHFRPMKVSEFETNTLQRTINGLINKITLQNAPALLTNIQEYYTGPRDKNDESTQNHFSAFTVTDAISSGIVKYLTKGLGEGEVRMRASSLLPLALLPKVVQICDGQHSTAALIKSLVDDFTTLLEDRTADEHHAALRNLTTFFCLLFELEVYDFALMGTFSLMLARSLSSSSADSRNTACDLLLLTMQLSGEKLRGLDPSMITTIIDTALTAADEAEYEKVSSRMSILLDFLQSMKYQKRPNKRTASSMEKSAPEASRLGIDTLPAMLQEAKTVLQGIFRSKDSRFALGMNKLSITWERCINATDARWWMPTTSAESSDLPKTELAFEVPEMESILTQQQFPFPSHPYDSIATLRCDTKLDTPVRIRCWNALVSSAGASHHISSDMLRKAAFQFVANVFTKSKSTGSETSLKKSISKHARDFPVVFDAIIEKLSLHAAHTEGTYLFLRCPLLTVLIPYLCEESREVRRCLYFRFTAWISWISGVKTKREAANENQQDQYLILLAHAQFAAGFAYHQRSRSTFVSKTASQLRAAFSSDPSASTALLPHIAVYLPTGGKVGAELTVPESYFIFLFSSLLSMCHGKNELLQTFYSVLTAENTVKASARLCAFLKLNFLQERFAPMLPLLCMQWKSLRESESDDEALASYLIENVRIITKWLQPEDTICV